MPQLTDALRDALHAHGDPAVAAAQFAYMKQVQPFHGVRTGERRMLLAETLKRYPVEDVETYRDNVKALWAGKYREERYLALDLAARLKAFRGEALPLFEEMLATADWWDVLDPLAIDLLGSALREQPALLDRNIRRWRRSEHPWTRRAAILVQLKYRDATNVDLLAETVLQLAGEQDFFIRKAIGWALREYSRTDPRWVERFVSDHQAELAPLSRREALRHV